MLLENVRLLNGSKRIKVIAKEHGIDYTVYKSGPYKDILSMWRNPSEKEDTLLQNVVNNVYNQFKADFIDSRKITEEHATSLAQGQIYTGQQALELDMVDKLGGYQDALNYIGELTGLNIVISPAVKDTITATLENVSVKAALDAILKPNGYSYFTQENIIIVTGDVTQVDLPKNQTSGLKIALERFKNQKGINIVQLVQLKQKFSIKQ